MKLRESCPRRTAAGVGARASLAALALACLPAAAEARQGGPDPAQSYRILMERRMELAGRAVTEAQRRRFEEGKTNTQFPSDAARRARPGVLRALTPAQQKALAHNEKGLALFGKRKFEPAVREYEAALLADAGLAAAHNNLGSALFALGRFEEAAAAFGRAVKVDEKYGQAHFNLALAQVKLGREREADASLMKAVRAYLLEGDGRLREGSLAEAEAAYRELLRIDEEYPPARLRLGLVYNADRRFAEALEEFRRVVRAQPANPAAHEGFAEAYYGLRRYAEAAEAAERALAVAPKSAGAHYFAGLAHAALGQRAQALARHARLHELGAADYARRLLEIIEAQAEK